MRHSVYPWLLIAWYLILGSVIGTILGMLGGFVVYCALGGGGGYYGEIGILFEFVLSGTVTGLLVGLGLGLYFGLQTRAEPEHSIEHLQAQLNRLSVEERDSIRRLFKSGCAVEAVQMTQQLLGVCHADAVVLAKALQRKRKKRTA